MKALAFLLAFANLAFCGWAMMIGEPARDPPPLPRAAPVGTLKLAVETSRPTQAGAPPAAGTRCVTVGPFLDETLADRAAILLRAERLAPRTRREDTAAGTAFQVSVRTASATEARRTAMRLAGAGIKDAEVTDARVAVGSYPTPADAAARVTLLRKLGVDPVVEESPRTVLAVWIDLDLTPADHPVDVAAIQATVGGGGGLGLKTCPAPAAATPADTPPATTGATPPDSSHGQAARAAA